MNRYMIYMPAGTQGRLVPCHLNGSLTLGEMETLVDGHIEVLDSSLEPEWAREPVDGIRLVVGEDAKLFDAKRNDKATWLYLHQDCDKIVGDAFLCAAVDGALIGFTKPVAKTIWRSLALTWRMTHGKTDSPAVQRHQERLLEHRQKGRAGAAPRPVRGHRPHPGGDQSAGRFQKQQG